MKNRLLRILLVSLVALILSACTAAQPAGKTPVKILLTFQPNVQFAPFYVALEKGYFADQGLDVTIEHQGESDVTRLVSSGEAQIGVVSGEQVLLARAQGIPVVYFYGWFQKYPVAIASKSAAGIAAPADLKGHSIGIPLKEGASYIGLEAILASAGLTDADIDLQVTGFNQVETLATDKVEAVVVYANNEPLQLAAQGIDSNILEASSYADLVSNGLIASEATIRDNPDLVRAVAAAFNQGLDASIKDPAMAFEASKKYVEGLDDPDVGSTQLKVLEATTALWQANRLGETQLSAWEQMQSLLIAMGLLSEEQDLSAAFTNDFLP